MVFKYQINPDIEFELNKNFIDKAMKFQPKIQKRIIGAKHLLHSENKNDVLDCEESINELSKKKFGKNQKIVLDFGQHIVGRFKINIKSIGSPMDAPLYIKLRFAEIRDEFKYDSNDYDGWLSSSWIQEEYIHIDNLPHLLSLNRRYSFRFVEITIIDTSPKWKVQFDNPVAISESSASDSRIKIPQIKDDKLRKIYTTSVRTLHECMQEVFEDGPKRDQRLWIGDFHLEALVDYKTFKQLDIVRRCLYLFAGMPSKDGRIPANIFWRNKLEPDDTFLFDYSLFFVSCLFDYYKETNDGEILKELFPMAKKQIDLAIELVDDQGKLILTDDWPAFIDWSNDFDKDTSAQAIMIYVLNQFIQLCNVLNKEYSMHYVKIRSKLICYSKNELFDSNEGLFVSGKEKDVNIASQSWMILANFLSKSEEKKIAHKMKLRLFPVKGITTPYMYHFIVEALFKAGCENDAIALIKDYWGKMIDLGADTFWEAFDINNTSFSPYGSPIVSSYCHAWSCTPAYLISKYYMKDGGKNE